MFYPVIVERYQEALEVAERESGIKLDGSIQSLHQLEEILTKDIGQRGAVPGKEIDPEQRSRLWGAYLGETIRFALGGYWLAEEETLTLSVFRRVICPEGYIRERLGGETETSVVDFYQQQLAVIKVVMDRGVFDPEEIRAPWMVYE